LGEVCGGKIIEETETSEGFTVCGCILLDYAAARTGHSHRPNIFEIPMERENRRTYQKNMKARGIF
jgi:hypothetical protein